MSRIGKRIITIPDNVNIDIEDSVITVKGPKGELSLTLVDNIKVVKEENNLKVEMLKDDKFTHAMQGTTNSHINNMIIGVTNGYTKALEIVGVGYRFNPKGNILSINAGYSHTVNLDVPKGINIKQISNTEIELEGIDKFLVSEFAANIRKVRKPEPYKGKGIKIKGEHIRRKEGKKASK